MSDRVILHCDCNSFFASVETVLNPQYKGVPMAVCGSERDRHGIVLAKNEQAKDKDVLVDDGNARHSFGAKSSHHNVIQQAHKIGDAVLNHDGNRNGEHHAIEFFVADIFL